MLYDFLHDQVACICVTHVHSQISSGLLSRLRDHVITILLCLPGMERILVLEKKRLCVDNIKSFIRFITSN